MKVYSHWLDCILAKKEGPQVVGDGMDVSALGTQLLLRQDDPTNLTVDGKEVGDIEGVGVGTVLAAPAATGIAPGTRVLYDAEASASSWVWEGDQVRLIDASHVLPVMGEGKAH